MLYFHWLKYLQKDISLIMLSNAGALSAERKPNVLTLVQRQLSHGVYIFDQLQIYTALLNL